MINNYFNYTDNIILHEECDTNIMVSNKKKNIIKRILKNEELLNYFDFQKDLFLLNKIINENKNKRILTKQNFTINKENIEIIIDRLPKKIIVF
jgi:hypothetical protein